MKITSCPCSPVFKQIKFYLCNKYKFTLQQFSIHPRPYLEIFNPLLPVRWNFQSTFTRTLKFSIHFYPYVEIFNSLLPVRFKVRAGMDWKTTFSIHFYPYVWEIKFSSFYLFKVSKSIQRFRSYSQQQILLSIGKNTSIGVAEIFTSN